ncbi:unnamed protein product [Paramecium octaurelia]|uniref:FAD-binding FR-type domain-containing protein n=1 Tax=Paramecium octaurelia TaxID=43137 RepID=A0A8S1XLE8_PAROT|nr:unnamed protein product [Paramecium octaurelia]
MIYIYIFAALLVVALIKLIWTSLISPKAPSALEPKHKREYLNCQLIEKTKLSHDTYNFKFALPSKKHALGIEVGQHIILHEQIKTKEYPEGELVERKYTPTSPVDQKGNFDLLIKIYRANEHPKFPDGGKLTSWIENMNPGESIHITGPGGRLMYLGYGNVQINKMPQLYRKKYKRIVMIAGGSGITPMYQIIQAVVKNNNDRTQLALLFANKSESDILLYNQLKAFASLKKLTLHLTLDNPPAQWIGFSGFVTRDMTEQAFGKLDSQTLALTCGPPMMNSLARTNFQSLGMNSDDIFEF